jgi:predicted dehydrogenase
MIAALQQHPRCRVVALWDPDAAALRDAAALAPDARHADSLAALVQADDIDAVYIASPPAFHLAGAQAVLAAGRAVLCEKPLTHRLAEALALRDAVLAAGRPFAVNFPFARAQAARQLVALVQSGQLGEIEQVKLTLRFSSWPRAWQAGAQPWLAGPAEGGFSREVLSHFVFLAHRLFGAGRIEGVQLERAPGQTETRLQARLVHGRVTVQIDAAVEGEVVDHNRFEVVGSRDRAALTSWYCLEHAGQTSARIDPSSSTLDGFTALLDGRSDQGLATVDEAVAVVQTIEALLA